MKEGKHWDSAGKLQRLQTIQGDELGAYRNKPVTETGR